ncbi:MAG: TRAP transporter substrate-binding protein DctP [Deltaproteobacteria bacterium]|nr:TRAP transporter substrate-binding protein DctP [Deltaproteobacteria bacterium]
MDKKLVIKLISFWCVISFLSIPALAGDKKFLLNVGSAWPSTTEIARNFTNNLFPMIQKGTRENIKLIWKSGPELIAARDLPSSAAAGVIDIFLSSPGYLAGQVKEGAIWDAYPLYRSYESTPRQFAEIKKVLDPIYEKKTKIKLLAMNNIHRFYIWTKEPVHSIKELQGRKIRAHGGLVPYVVRGIGAVPTTIPTAEVYMALERGVVKGSARPLTSLSSYKEYEVARYGINETITWGTGLVYISMKSWKKLGAQLQDELMAICQKFTEVSAEYWQKRHDDLKKELTSQGKIEWYEMSAKERNEWKELVAAGGMDGVKTLSHTIGPKIVDIFKKYK